MMRTGFLIVLLGFASFVQAQQLELSGFWKAMPSRTTIPFLLDEPMSQAYLHQRTNLKWRSADRAWTVRLEARTRVFFGSQVEQTAGFFEGLSADAGVWDGSWNWWEAADERGVGNTLIDRALVSYRRNRLRVDLGRQRINWGRHAVWNPNDVFNAYNFFDFDYAERPGTDALRVRWSVGENGMNEVDVAARPGTPERAPLVAGLFRWNVRGVDGQILSAYLEDTYAVGGAFSAGWGPLSLKAEATHFGAAAAWGDSAIWSGTVGLDATWGKGAFAQLAVLRTPGLGGSALLGLSAGGQTTQQPWSLLPFTRTYMTQLTLPVTERLRMGGALLWAPNDDVLIAMPSVVFDAARNLTASLIVQHVRARPPFGPDASMETLTTAAFLSLQWNFRVRNLL